MLTKEQIAEGHVEMLEGKTEGDEFSFSEDFVKQHPDYVMNEAYHQLFQQKSAEFMSEMLAASFYNGARFAEKKIAQEAVNDNS